MMAVRTAPIALTMVIKQAPMARKIPVMQDTTAPIVIV